MNTGKFTSIDWRFMNEIVLLLAVKINTSSKINWFENVRLHDFEKCTTFKNMKFSFLNSK